MLVVLEYLALSNFRFHQFLSSVFPQFCTWECQRHRRVVSGAPWAIDLGGIMNNNCGVDQRGGVDNNGGIHHWDTNRVGNVDNGIGGRGEQVSVVKSYFRENG